MWAYYRLNMYATVATLDCRQQDWRTSVAKAVAFAACGRYAEAETVVRKILFRPEWIVHRLTLAKAMAAFMPELALRILEGMHAPAAFRAALLLSVGDNKDAQRVIDAVLNPAEIATDPELHLYRANVHRGPPRDQLGRLNAFLLAREVPAVELIDDTLPPSPCNVRCASSVSPVDGPLVSVLMTTYKTAERVDSAIRSILGQSYKNIELIAVDDGSEDHTPVVLQKWADKDRRVKVLRLQRNVGTYVAKNVGLKLARGEFVTCHDSDDWSHPLKIERQVKPLLKNHRLIGTTSHWLRMTDDGFYYARAVYPLMRLNLSSLLFRREEVLSYAGIWDGVRTGADSEFAARLRLVFGNDSVYAVRQPLALGSHRQGSLMTAPSTGYSSKAGAAQRLKYWEEWSHWHIETLRVQDRPRLSSELYSEKANLSKNVPREVAELLSDMMTHRQLC